MAWQDIINIQPHKKRHYGKDFISPLRPPPCLLPHLSSRSSPSLGLSSAPNAFQVGGYPTAHPCSLPGAESSPKKRFDPTESWFKMHSVIPPGLTGHGLSLPHVNTFASSSAADNPTFTWQQCQREAPASPQTLPVSLLRPSFPGAPSTHTLSSAPSCKPPIILQGSGHPHVLGAPTALRSDNGHSINRTI